MPVDLPPTSALEQTANDVAGELGVSHPPLLDDLSEAASPIGDHGCLRLHLGHEVALASHVHVSTS